MVKRLLSVQVLSFFFSFLSGQNSSVLPVTLAYVVNPTDHSCTGDGNLSVILGVAWREYPITAVNSS